MKKLSLILTFILILSAFAAHAGKALMEAGDAQFELASYTYLGMDKNARSLKQISVDRKTSMILFSDDGREFYTACRGVYEYQLLSLSNKVVGLNCVTQNGRTRVTYIRVD